MSFSQNSGSGGSIDITTLAKEAKQDTGNSSLASIDTKLTSPISANAVINYKDY